MLRRVGRCSIRATFSEDSTRSSWVIVNVIGQVVDKIVENTPTIEAICMAPHIVQSQFRLETSLVTYAKVGTSVSILGSLRGLEKETRRFNLPVPGLLALFAAAKQARLDMRSKM